MLFHASYKNSPTKEERVLEQLKNSFCSHESPIPVQRWRKQNLK